jgi:hypothetical protein
MPEQGEKKSFLSGVPVALFACEAIHMLDDQ